MFRTFFSTTPMLRILIPLVLGILAHFWSISFYFLVLILVLYTVLFFLLQEKSKLKSRNQIVRSGLIISAATCCLGFTLHFLHNETIYSEHYTHAKTPSFFELVIIEPGIQKTKSTKYLTQVILAIDSNYNASHTFGKLLVYIQNYNTTYQIGQHLIIPASYVRQPDPPLNPGTFNYRFFLELKNISHVAYVPKNKIIILNEIQKFITTNWVYATQNFFKSTLQKFIGPGVESAIAEALIDGNDNDIDNITIDAYAKTGTLHVLAVSGMHVGIIFWILGVSMKSFDKKKQSKFIKNIIILIALWLYAMLCGMSPSILRATIMFSFIVFGSIINQPGNIYNTLAASAFILLCINPNTLFDAGFQLSYGAVVGIVFLQPYINHWIHSRHTLINKIWELNAVSIAAQIGTLPIGLYYFHQFPLTFMFSNLIIIPLTTIILYLSISLIILSPFTIIATYLGKLIFILIQLCNSIAQGFKNLPNASIENINLSLPNSILLYLLISTLIAFFLTSKIYHFKLALLLILMLSVQETVNYLQFSKQHQFVFYASNKNYFIRHIYGHNAILFSDTNIISNNTLQGDFRIKRLVKDSIVQLDSNWTSLSLNTYTIMLNGNRPFSSSNTFDYLYLRYPIPIENLRALHFRHLIIPIHIHKHHSQKWIAYCNSNKIPFTLLKESGAFELNLKHDE